MCNKTQREDVSDFPGFLLASPYCQLLQDFFQNTITFFEFQNTITFLFGRVGCSDFWSDLVWS